MSGHLLAISTAVVVVTAYTPASSADVYSWTSTSANVSSNILQGIGAVDDLRSLNTAVEAGSFSKNILDYGSGAVRVRGPLIPGAVSYPIQGVLFGFETYQRMQEYKINFGLAASEQTMIAGSSMALSHSLNSALTGCFASGACAVTGGTVALGAVAATGIVIDSVQVARAFKSALDYNHELQQEAAAWDQVGQLADRRRMELENKRKELQQRNLQPTQQKVVVSSRSANQLDNPAPPNTPAISKSLSASSVNTKNAFQNTATSQPKSSTLSASTSATPQPGTGKVASINAGEIQSLKNNTSALKPPAPATSSPVQPNFVAPQSSYTGFRAPAPGGVSLSRAAAERMPLNLTLDASSLSNGKIILSGRPAMGGIDAALFLTTLRAACDDRDPYFSLDPDDGAIWSQQGDQASNEFWKRIKKDFPAEAARGGKNDRGVQIRTISATQDYPSIWHDISPHYPNFRSKLVFYPEWLRQTRLGEILYKADVLLKELSSGVSILVPGKLRALAVPGYLSSDIEYTAKSFLARTDQAASRPQWRGSRLWFDIAPSASPSTGSAETPPLSSSADPALRALLQSNGFVRPTNQIVRDASFVVQHGTVLDLSQVNPRMFVRVHDPATNEDLSDHDPRLDGLATDVSTRFDQYVEFYGELRLLRDIFRAYIAAVKITAGNEWLCRSLDTLPLDASEKVAAPLPDYHPSELFVTIGNYWTTSRKGGEAQFVRTSSVSGGVSIAGQQFAETATRDGETTVTRAVETAIMTGSFDQPGAVDSDRKFVSFVVDDGTGAPVRLASNTTDPLAPRSLSDYPIENEPPAAERLLNPRPNNAIILAVLLTFLATAFVVIYRSPVRGGRR